MPAKLKRCVKHLIAKGKSKDSAWPICVSSTGLKPHKKKTKKSVDEGKSTGTEPIETSDRIIKYLSKLKKQTPQQKGRTKSQVWNILSKMRKRHNISGVEAFNKVLPHYQKYDQPEVKVKTKKMKEQVVKEYLESKGIEATPEQINEFLGSLAGFVGGRMRKFAFKGVGAGNKLMKYSQKKAQQKQNKKTIKTSNKQTNKVDDELRKVIKKGPGYFKSVKGEVTHLRQLQKEISRNRLAAKGITLKGKPGNFPKQKDYATLKRQLERFVEEEKKLLNG